MFSLSNSDVVALIPARSGSKGIVDKNLAEILGYSLLEWSVRAALASKFISKVVVSTDSKVYAEKAISFGAEVPFLRPESISQDHSPDIDFVSHFLENLPNKNDYPKVIVHLRPTTPTRDPKIIDLAIKTLLNNSKFTSLRSVQKMSESCYKAFEMDQDNRLTAAFSHETDLDKFNSARQLFPDTFVANGYVDVIRTDLVLSSKLMHGSRVLGFKTEPIIEVDSIFDLKILQVMMSNDENQKYLSIFE